LKKLSRFLIIFSLNGGFVGGYRPQAKLWASKADRLEIRVGGLTDKSKLKS